MKKLIIRILIGFLMMGLFSGELANPKTASAASSGTNDSLEEIAARGWSVYRRPFDVDSHVVANTNRMVHQLVVIRAKRARGPRTEDLIQRQGKTLGWLDARALRRPRSYVLPYHYVSQLFPLRAPEACEAASLKMALSVKGLDRDYGLQYIINHMPKSPDSSRGFSGNPYRDNSGLNYWLNLIRHGFNTIFGQTIYPKPLARYARRYDPEAKDITGASKLKLIHEIKHGNPVVFVGSFQMERHTDSYHILALVGYRPGQFLIADPYRHWDQPHRVFWVSTHRMMAIFGSQIRHRRAVVI